MMMRGRTEPVYIETFHIFLKKKPKHRYTIYITLADISSVTTRWRVCLPLDRGKKRERESQQILLKDNRESEQNRSSMFTVPDAESAMIALTSFSIAVIAGVFYTVFSS